VDVGRLGVNTRNGAGIDSTGNGSTLTYDARIAISRVREAYTEFPQSTEWFFIQENKGFSKSLCVHKTYPIVHRIQTTRGLAHFSLGTGSVFVFENMCLSPSLLCLSPSLQSMVRTSRSESLRALSIERGLISRGCERRAKAFLRFLCCLLFKNLLKQKANEGNEETQMSSN